MESGSAEASLEPEIIGGVGAGLELEATGLGLEPGYTTCMPAWR